MLAHSKYYRIKEIKMFHDKIEKFYLKWIFIMEAFVFDRHLTDNQVSS